MAAWGLSCRTWAFPGGGEQGLLPSRRAQASQCGGRSCCGAQALDRVHSVVVVHGLICSVARGIFLGWGSNPCPLHLQVDSYPLYYQGRRSNFS